MKIPRHFLGLFLVTSLIRDAIANDGFDKSKRKKLRAEIERYNQCKTEKNRTLTETRDYGELRLVDEGRSMTLSCPICRPPTRSKLDDDIRWYRRTLASPSDQQLDLDTGRFASKPEWNGLVIQGARLEDAGEYWCEDGPTLEKVYLVDVQLEEPAIEVYESGAVNGTMPRNDTTLPEHNIRLRTVWTAWSACSTCDRKGTRTRYGMCTLQKLLLHEPTRPVDEPLLNTYRDGIPCRSRVLPPRLRQLAQHRYNEILVGKCFVSCANQTSTAHETGTKYLGLDQKPELPPLVVRRSVFRNPGQSVVFDCPHGNAMGTIVRWQNGTETLINSELKQRTNNRAGIDLTHRLYIKYALAQDERPYSCWTNGRHVATYRLRIIPARQVTWFHQLATYAGALVTATTFCTVACSVRKNRYLKTMR